MASKVASDFEKIINTERSRKKNEALAAKIFKTQDRRASAPGRATGGPGGTLANRSGVKKQQQQRVASQTARPPPGNIDGEWTHDLHNSSSSPAGAAAARGGGGGGPKQASGSGAGSLASRISVPGAIRPSVRAQRRAAQVAQALIKTELQPSTAARTNALSSTLTAAGGNRGLTIRGLAGPFVVMAQNFAPGTTAADIESAMTPVGGMVSSCRLLKTAPIVIAEIIFESKDGAERVIETFNNQTADGRVLHVYPKVGGGGGFAAPPSGPKAAQPSSNVVDGSMGFDDPMAMDGSNAAASGRKDGGLYSDGLLGGGGGGSAGGGGGRRGGGSAFQRPVSLRGRSNGGGR